MSQKPKIATTFLPGIIGFTLPSNNKLNKPFYIFYAIMLLPASPKPIAIKAPTFKIVLCKIYNSEFF